MIVIVDNKRPTGAGESLSGARAFYINKGMMEDWQAVENHPEYRQLEPGEREIVKTKFPLSVEIYKMIWSTRFR
jgi:hypothetical protein